MSDVPDSAIIEMFFKYVAPTVGTVAGIISGLIAWMWKGLVNKVDDAMGRITSLEVELPERYAGKVETKDSLRDVGERIDRFGDKVDVRLQTIESDVKDLLKIMVEHKAKR